MKVSMVAGEGGERTDGARRAKPNPPVVSHRNDPLDLLLLEQLHKVLRQRRVSVRLDLPGLGRPAVSEHVDGDCRVTLGREVGNLSGVVAGRAGEAVHEEEGGLAAGKYRRRGMGIGVGVASGGGEGGRHGWEGGENEMAIGETTQKRIKRAG